MVIYKVLANSNYFALSTRSTDAAYFLFLALLLCLQGYRCDIVLVMHTPHIHAHIYTHTHTHTHTHARTHTHKW
jgi:hypothetical protein